MSFSLKNVVGVISFLPTLDALISSTVQQVEATLGTFGGSEKYQAALAKVDSFIAGLSADINVVQDLQAIAGPIINAWVAAFNAVGFFQHKSAAQPAQHL